MYTQNWLMTPWWHGSHNLRQKKIFNFATACMSFVLVKGMQIWWRVFLLLYFTQSLNLQRIITTNIVIMVLLLPNGRVFRYGWSFVLLLFSVSGTLGLAVMEFENLNGSAVNGYCSCTCLLFCLKLSLVFSFILFCNRRWIFVICDSSSLCPARTGKLWVPTSLREWLWYSYLCVTDLMIIC